MSQNICRNCKWADWRMTNHTPPRVNKRINGRCQYPLERVAIPVSLNYRVEEHYKSAIWWEHDKQCRVWEKK